MESPPEPLIWDEAMLRRFWNYYADRPHVYFSSAFGRSILRQFRPWLRPGLRALDYGCGSGGLIAALLEAGIQAGGVEANHSARDKIDASFSGRPNFLGVWAAEHARSAPELAGRFDVVFLVEVIEHLDDAALVMTLSALKSLLAPGGWLICTTPNDEDIDAAMVFCPASGKVFHPMQHVRSWTAETLTARLAAAGLGDTRSWTTDFGADLKLFPRQWAVRSAKRLMRFPYKDPHLVAIGRVAERV